MSVSAHEIRSIIGDAALNELIEAYGGRRVYVPSVMRPHHPLALRLGLGPALLLSQYCPGEHLDVPTGRSMQIEARNRLIVREVEAGASISAVARKWGLSDRHARRIIRQIRSEVEHG